MEQERKNIDYRNLALSFIENKMWCIDLDYGLSELSNFIMALATNTGASLININSERVSITDASKGTFANNESGDIAVLSLSGTMVTASQPCGAKGIDALSNELYAAYGNENIKGILLKIHSGGGQSSAGTLLKNTLMDANKPVVVHSSLMASAALMGALPAKEIIMSDESSQSGSIGTYIQINREFAKMYTEQIDTIYADASPNKNKSIREYLAGDSTSIKEEVNKHAIAFQNEVKKFRNLTNMGFEKEYIKETLSGGMFNASEAKKRGLIDGIGTLNHAFKRLNSRIKNNY